MKLHRENELAWCLLLRYMLLITEDHCKAQPLWEEQEYRDIDVQTYWSIFNPHVSQHMTPRSRIFFTGSTLRVTSRGHFISTLMKILSARGSFDIVSPEDYRIKKSCWSFRYFDFKHFQLIKVMYFIMVHTGDFFVVVFFS